jgi:hypothetical protein
MSTTQTTSTRETPTLTTRTDTILIQTTVMSTTLTTNTLETPTSNIPTLRAIRLAPVLDAHTLQAHSTMTYLPSPGNQPNSSSGKPLVKQDPQNQSYPRPRKARKRHKKHPKPSPPSPPVAGALCAQIKETQQLPIHSPIPLTMESSYEHKKRPNQGSPPTPNKAERAQPTETHPPTIHPPYPHHGELLPLVFRTRMSHTQPRLLMDTKCL